MYHEGTMHYDELIGRVRPLVGQRIRLTSFNGFQRVGRVGLWHNRGSGEDHPTLGAYQSGERWIGGRLMGGEFDGTIAKIEVMQANGRYAEIS